MALVRPDLGDFNTATNLMFNETIRQMMQSGRKIYHFGFGQSPFPVIETAVVALKENAGQNAYLPVQASWVLIVSSRNTLAGYSGSHPEDYTRLLLGNNMLEKPGIPELRQALCKFHAEYDGLNDLDVNNIIVGPGSKELIYLLMNVFNGTVILLSPSWTTYKPQAELAGKTPVILPVSTDSQWRLTPSVLEKALESNNITGNKLLVMTNPDNPTGACYRECDLQALSEVFRKHNVIVLSDEIYARLHYDHTHETLVKYYPEGTIISTGVSKWASAGGWRLGYHIYPPELSSLLAAVKSASSHTFSCAPAPIQYAAAKMMSDLESCEEYIRHTTRVMKAASSFCCKELRSAGVKVATSTAGYYIFPDFNVIRPALKKRGVTTGTDMCRVMLEEASVALMAGGPAYLRPVDELTTRLCYVNFDGKDALNHSRKLGLETPLPDTFVQEFCTPLYDGIVALKNWVLRQLNEQNAHVM